MTTMTAPCPFCAPDASRIIFRDALVTALWDMFPVNPGHALIVPNRHVAGWAEASVQERAALMEAVDRVRAEIAARFRADGFNVGFNDGAAAGQTVFHLHVHVIPRISGDMADPRGGVRYVVPGRARYWEKAVAGAAQQPDKTRSLVTGGLVDPLLPDLKYHLSRSRQADICVAFTLRTGIELLQEDLQEMLDRGGRLRLLTGDYLDATDPDALARLTDLKGDAECRVFVTQAAGLPGMEGRSFHPKSYLFHHNDGSSAAFVGSSNLSESALRDGIEWNYRLSDAAGDAGIAEVRDAFDALFAHKRTVPLTDAWIAAYRKRRIRPKMNPVREVAEDPDPTIYTPHAIQVEALAALKETRREGREAGLVVLATGLGKTWLSAFDSLAFHRILFVAHRDEILQQARNTFRKVRPLARLGFFTGSDKDAGADVLFASVQTLSRQPHLETFAADAFDYIVIDEFHHADARTYRKLIDHFRPKFLLGLTATPERSDGGDLLGLCGENLVYRCDVGEGIRQGLLSPFRYLGVPDTIDYANIPWRNSRFDEQELTKAAATLQRAENALVQFRKHGGSRTIAFCVSQVHADFMADFFTRQGIAAVAVHAGQSSAPRTASLEMLRDGKLQVVCAVDMFNEGVDLPELDTILMLRPTASRIIWLQQFGRGLRKGADGKVLSVIDYIGNHKSFLVSAMALFNIGDDRQELRRVLDDLEHDAVDLPPGCAVTYELEAKDILRQLLAPRGTASGLLTQRYEDFVVLNGRRPTAVEMFREGFRPRSVHPDFGSWLRFVQAQGGLDQLERLALEDQAVFLGDLDTTQMSKSFKMLVLQAMLNRGRFPGPVSLEELAIEIQKMAGRDRRIADDLGDSGGSVPRLVAMLRKNPVAAWTGEASGGFFELDDAGFRYRGAIPAQLSGAFADLVREVCEWRLEEYFARAPVAGANEFELKVIHANRKPILMLPDRQRVPGLPSGWTDVRADGEVIALNFVKVAVNVGRRDASSVNVLPDLLRAWFGADAGLPGTGYRVRLVGGKDGWRLEPVRPGSA